MLAFFRKYQRYFFIVITVVIIISFSFFGTYSTLTPDVAREQIAFTAVDGTQIKRHDLDEMAFFLGTDSIDKMLLGGSWGANFLNDGVVKKDILETGLGEIIAANYGDLIKTDLQTRLEKEKYYALYTHPQAKFIGIESAWGYFAPEMKTSYQNLKQATDPVSSEAFNQRVHLYLGQLQLNPAILKQILRYQEKQQQWIKPDPNLDQQDLFLFGYRTADDWFGPRFLRLVSEFIINSAIIAEEKGYKVSKAEALADLMRNASLSFQQNQRNPYLGVTSSTEYFNEQLRLLNMDQTKAVKIWRQVMLFRRLFDDVGNAVIVDPMAYEQFKSYAGVVVAGDIYKMPPSLQFGNARALEKFEFYLNAVAKPQKNPLDLPKTFLTVEEVFKKYPELVQKQYLLDIAEVKKSALQSKVGLKETWNWEVEGANWEALKKKFPDLALKKAETREERFAELDKLDEKTRSKVDKFARMEILNSHPEWIAAALANAPKNRETVGLRAKGGNFPFKGVSDREKFIQLLDKASLFDQTENQTAQQLHQYTGDEETYYRISVVDRAKNPEILTFEEASQEGVLDALLDSELEKAYVKIREASPESFQKEDKSWKSFADVRDAVAERHFEKIFKAVQQDYASAIAPEKAPSVFLADYTASLRFYKHMRQAEESIKKSPEEISLFVVSEMPEEEAGTKLAPRQPLEAQWKLIREDYRIAKSGQAENKSDLFHLAANDWSKVNTPANGDINFVHLLKKELANEERTAEKMTQIHGLISADAQRHYMRNLLKLLKEKEALSLNYLNVSETSMGPDES